MKADDGDDTVSVKISGVASFETITAGDGHAVAKMGNSYTFTLTDVQSGLTLHSSCRGEDRHYRHSEQVTLTLTASNTTAGEKATSAGQTLEIQNSGAEHHHHPALFDQYVSAGFRHEHDVGQVTSFTDRRGDQEHPTLLSAPHHQG
ncbi:MAG: hypothetical protein JO145_15090 [Acidobacteriaceae bacterium]|nr:hypothetical protein [Acidobacteriaceae bacterium]MBV9751621.1 hypothetical protein [Hyphomicrobiales bacterium]